MSQITTSAGTITYPEVVGRNESRVIATAWEKAGKVRVYFKTCGVDCGYFDIIEKKAYMRSNPVTWAQRIEEGIEVVSSANGVLTPGTADYDLFVNHGE